MQSCRCTAILVAFFVRWTAHNSFSSGSATQPAARHARTHTSLKHNTLLSGRTNHSRRATTRDTCTAPRNNRPATCRCLAGVHKRTTHTAPAPSGSTGRRRVTPGGVPHYLHHISITAKPERRTMPRLYTHTALRSPRNPDAWVCRPFLRQVSGENPGESPSTSTQIRTKKLSASGA